MSVKFGRTLLLSSFIIPCTLFAQLPEPDGGMLVPGVLPEAWVTGGPKCMEIPEFQIHEYNPDFYILRQSGCSHYEKPFLYLMFGEDRALLYDTGAGKTNVGQVVMDVVAKWIQRNRRESIPLVVSHSHNHGDHTAGDAQFASAPDTTLVGADLASVTSYFGFDDFAGETVEFDLGGRVLDLMGIPGHQDASLAIYDRQTGILLTGDTVYPGRIYVRDGEALARSIHRLVEFTASRPLAHVFGTHIEQSDTPFLEFPIGSIYQPHEHRLELTRGTLLEMDQALQQMSGNVVRYAMRDLTIYPTSPEVSRAMGEVKTATETSQRKRMWNQLEEE